MAVLKGGQAEIDRIQFLEDTIAKAVIPYRENTEAALVVFAAMRVVRRLIKLYPEATRTDLIEACIAYLVQDEDGDGTPRVVSELGKGILQ